MTLALHLGRSGEHVLVLSEQIISRIAVQERIKLLEEALDRTEMLEEFGFLVPTLRLLFGDRNTMAHSVTLDLRQSAALLLTLRKERPTEVEVTADDLVVSIRRAQGCIRDLAALEPRIGGPLLWAAIHGFDEGVEVDAVDGLLNQMTKSV